MDLADRGSMCSPRVGLLVALCVSLCVSLLPAGPLAAQNTQPPNPDLVPGATYVVSATGASGPHGVAAAANPTILQNYIGHVSFAEGRGRMDIVEGGVEQLFSKGDYLLFDSSDVLVVRPAQREFFAIPRDIASRGIAQLQALGARITVSDERVTLDSLGPGDTISGVPTRHYRMTVGFNLSMDAGIIQQRLGTENVIDYWVASSPVIPPNPLLRANGFAMGAVTVGAFTTLSAKVDSAAAKMGNLAALKTRSVTRLNTGPGTMVETQQDYEVSEIEHRDVDEKMLILPPGLKAMVLPGVGGDAAGVDSLGAKWRKPPASSSRPD